MKQPTLFPGSEPVEKAATVSECGLYRYDLRRMWERGPHVTFLLFNPSTADAEDDDPTSRKCDGFARRWGYSGFVIVNLYAFRAAKVKDLWKAADPVGPLNDEFILRHAGEGPLIAAWGAKPKAKARVVEVYEKLRAMGRTFKAIRETKDGHPEHPLFLPYGLGAGEWGPGDRKGREQGK